MVIQLLINHSYQPLLVDVNDHIIGASDAAISNGVFHVNRSGAISESNMRIIFNFNHAVVRGIVASRFYENGTVVAQRARQALHGCAQFQLRLHDILRQI